VALITAYEWPVMILSIEFEFVPAAMRYPLATAFERILNT